MDNDDKKLKPPPTNSLLSLGSLSPTTTLGSSLSVGSSSATNSLGSLLGLIDQRPTTSPSVDKTLERFNDIDKRIASYEKIIQESQQEVAKLKNELKESKTEFAKQGTELKNTKQEITELGIELKDSKKDYVVFLGLFASLIAYLTIEIQILKTITDFFLLLGLSAFILVALLLFSLSLNHLTKEKVSWKEFYSPVFIIIYILAIASCACFYLNASKIKPDSVIKNQVTTPVNKSKLKDHV
ncbi:MAG: DUF2203 family protein [Gammaproteobacteria bacterium]